MAAILAAQHAEFALWVGACASASSYDCSRAADIWHCHRGSVTGLDTGCVVAGVDTHDFRLAAAGSNSNLAGDCMPSRTPSGGHRSDEVHALPDALRIWTPTGRTVR